MKMIAKRTERSLTLYLSGELDHHAAKDAMAEIDRNLDAALPLRTELELSQLTFMDSSGIAVVLRLYKRMQNLGGSLRLTHVPAQALRVLRTAGIDRIVTIEEGEKKS